MPELPDIDLYLAALEPRIVGQPLQRVRLKAPYLLKSVDPSVVEVEGKRITGLRRLGKRIVFELEDDLFMVFHLMIAGRYQWRHPGAKPPGKIGVASFDFPDGTLVLTEASSKKRASLFIVRGKAALEEHDPGGIDVLASTAETFAEVLRSENHTLKRSLTDPRLFSGIGNAYSDEILHAARLSPVRLTSRLTDEEIERLHEKTLEVLQAWSQRLIEETGDAFPTKVTAFRPGMAVHGRHGEPCPDCGDPVQRIAYADNETNYCATCQTGGRLLADRALSRLLKKDWPRSLEELERHKDDRRL